MLIKPPTPIPREKTNLSSVQRGQSEESHVLGNVLDFGNRSLSEMQIDPARCFLSFSLRYFDGLLRVSIAEHGDARDTAEDRSEILEEGAEEGHDLTGGNVQGSTDSVAVLRRFLVGIESIGEKLEARNLVGDRQPQRSKSFDPGKRECLVRTRVKCVTDFNPARICIALLKLPMYQQVTAHRTIEATIAFRS